MGYQFLIDTYETELLKVVSAWSMFHDDDLPVRPHPTEKCAEAEPGLWCEGSRIRRIIVASR